MKNKALLPTIFLLVFVAIVACAVWARRHGTVGRQQQPGGEGVSPPLTEFTLVERSGDPFHSSDLAGQVWVASYFFTQCGANCRILNMNISELQREFGPQGVRFLSISCDPTNDSAAALDKYAQLFRADESQWLFLTGDFKYVQRIGRDMFNVLVSRRAHNTQLVVVDRAGQRRGSYDGSDPYELAKTRRLLEELLNEKDAPLTATGH